MAKTKKSPDVNTGYDAGSIQVLEGLEAVRKRPGMYIGDINERGLHHLVFEILDNSVDEHLAGHGKMIKLTIHTDNSITVQDEGRGIPVDVHQKEGKSALEVVLTKLHAGGKFNNNSYKVSGGLHGVGAAVVNALSVNLTAKVARNGKLYTQSYKRGKPLSEIEQIGTSKKTGTSIYFKPDPKIFTVTEFTASVLTKRCEDLSYLNSGLTFEITDERDGKSWKFYSEGGLVDYISKHTKRKRTLLPAPLHITAQEGAHGVEIALQYSDNYTEEVHSFVNNINTTEGGTHVMGFRKSLTRVLNKYAKNNGFLDKLKFEVISEDYREGVTCAISVKVPNPQFEGQTKTKLGNREVSGIVETICNRALESYLEENPRIAQQIIRKVIVAAEARFEAKKAKERVTNKAAQGIYNSTLPGKLADCQVKKPRLRELFLVEGDSAGGSAKQGRNRKFQAILPLRGKVLNVERVYNPSKIYENEEIKNILTALGLLGYIETLGDDLPTKCRYHKIVIMTDADIDGSHIRTLLLTLFYRYLKPIINAGYLYIARPPLYCVKYKKKDYYVYTEEELQNRLSKIEEKNGSTKGVTIQRYKGLGEMNAEQLWSTTMDPDKRTLYRVTIEDAHEADIMFDLLMSDEVEPRREFIESNAHYARIDI